MAISTKKEFTCETIAITACIEHGRVEALLTHMTIFNLTLVKYQINVPSFDSLVDLNVLQVLTNTT
jgi:hypothetical protein